jgi:hypothetical protein
MFHWRGLSRDSDFMYCPLCFTDVFYPRIVIFCTVPSVSLTWSIPWYWFSVLFPLFHWRGLSRDNDFLYCSLFHWRGISRDSDFLYCSLCFTDVVYPRIVIFCTVPSVSLTWSIPWYWFSVLFLLFHWRGLSRDSDFLYCSLFHWRDLSRDTDFLYCSLCFTDVVYPRIEIFCTVPPVSLTWSIPG